jgi:hypothetical protein
VRRYRALPPRSIPRRVKKRQLYMLVMYLLCRGTNCWPHIYEPHPLSVKSWDSFTPGSLRGSIIIWTILI